MKRFIAEFRQRAIARLAACPLPTPLALLRQGRVLVFAPHPDDETLGCGGTMALLRQNHCTVRVVVVTDGSGAGTLPATAVSIRREETRAAMEVLGVDDIVFLDEPDGSFRNHPRFMREVTALLEKFEPDWIFLPSLLDYHRDHVAIGDALLQCWQCWRGSARAFFYEIWSPLPATHVVDIGAVEDLKRAAISCYALPLEHCDYLSASMGLAAYRGLYLSGNGRRALAEAFTEADRGTFLPTFSSKLLALRLALERRLE